MAQQLVQTKMDFEDLAPIALPDFGHTGDQKPLTTTPEGANARFFQCRVLKNSPQVPGDATTVVGSATGTQPFGLEFGETIQAGFGQPVNEVTFTLINNNVGGIIGGRAVTGQTFRVLAMDNAFHSQTQLVTLALVQTVKVTISLPDVRFISVTPLPVNGPIIPVLYWRYFLDDFEFKFQPPDTSRFLFTLPAGNPQKVLIHKYRTDDGYPSPLQQHDRQITVEGFVTNSANVPLAGRTVYFRMIDPPDPAPYVVTGGDSRAGDNVDGMGTLSAFTAVSAANGYVSVDLTVTDHVAGDNYQIEASLDPGFNCGAAGCPKSATYTAWKRVYVEMHKMFRRGSFLTADVLAGAKRISVRDIHNLPNPPFRVRLLHAPPVAGSGQFSTTEEVTITAISPTEGFFNHPRAGDLLIATTGPGVAQSYFGPELVNPNDARLYLADAVGVVSGNRSTDFFIADATQINSTFESAYTEHVWLTDARPNIDSDMLAGQPRLTFEGVVPFAPDVSDPNVRDWITRKWLYYATRSGKDRTALANHQAVFAGSDGGGELGTTAAGSGYNDTWLYVAGTGIGVLRREALVHELAHQWRVNPTANQMASGHCDLALAAVQYIYDKPTLKCAMTYNLYGNPDDPERSDGVVGFHYAHTSHGPDSEYLRIRQRAEPVPQNDPPARPNLQ